MTHDDLESYRFLLQAHDVRWTSESGGSMSIGMVPQITRQQHIRTASFTFCTLWRFVTSLLDNCRLTPFIRPSFALSFPFISELFFFNVFDLPKAASGSAAKLWWVPGSSLGINWRLFWNWSNRLKSFDSGFFCSAILRLNVAKKNVFDRFDGSYTSFGYLMIIGMMDAYTPLPRFSVSTQCGPRSFLNLYAFLAFLWSSSDLETKI